ncbi:MAG: zinc-binding dehydrogenase [Pseudomonadota bacterium]
MRAVVVENRGEPDVLTLTESPVPTIGSQDVLIAVEAAGVNYADLMQHRGTYPLRLPLPYVAGMEAIGRVVAAGPACQRFAVGDRVAAISFAGGAYAEHLCVPEAMAFLVPEDADAGFVLALLIQGLTAHALLSQSARLREGERALVHAAAGGVGLLSIQLASSAGAGRIIGVVGDDQKAALVKEAGADLVINRKTEDWVSRLSGEGDKVDVVLDPVGASNTAGHLAVLGDGGRIVFYGWLSGACPDLTSEQTQAMLFANQSLVGFALDALFRLQSDHVQTIWADLMQMLSNGVLKPRALMLEGLESASAAHGSLAKGDNQGKLCLKVS